MPTRLLISMPLACTDGQPGWAMRGRRLRSVLPGALLLGLILAFPPGPHGTLVAQSAPAPRSDTTLAARLATITTDTGPFAPGHRDFSRYDHPMLCQFAADRERGRAQHSLAAQMIQDSMIFDTIGARAAAAVVHACADRFLRAPLADMKERELSRFFDLAVQAEADSLARAILSRHLSFARTPRDSLALYDYAINTMRQYGRKEAFFTLVAQINALPSGGRTGLRFRFSTANALRSIYYGAGRFAHTGLQVADSAHFWANDSTLLRLSDSLQADPNAPWTHDLDVLWAEEAVLGDFAERDWFTGHTELIPDLVQRYKKRIPEFRDELIGTPFQHYLTDADDVLREDLQGTEFSVLDGTVSGGGWPAPRLTADHWYPAPGHPANDTVRPIPHKVNVFCREGRVHSMSYQNDSLVLANINKTNNAKGPWSGGVIGGGGSVMVEWMRHWLATYSADQLALTVVQVAQGDVEQMIGKGYGFWTWFADPVQEAGMWRWLTQSYDQMPVTVAVQVRHSTFRPPPDGRRTELSNAQFFGYWSHDRETLRSEINFGGDNDACVVIDRGGMVRYVTTRDVDAEGRAMDNVLRWLITGPGATSSHAMQVAPPPAALPVPAASSTGGRR